MSTQYRYELRRLFFDSPTSKTILFCMLNPSTADEIKDDPTIRRCRNFAIREGARQMIVANLFAARATSPKDLWRLPTPEAEGPDNISYIHYLAKQADVIIAAWGNLPAKHHSYADAILKLALGDSGRPVYRLGSPTKSGQPRHPLYLRKDTPLELHYQHPSTNNKSTAQ